MHTDRHSDALTQICTTCTEGCATVSIACMRHARVQRCTVVYGVRARARRGLCPSVAGMAGDGKNYANTDNNSIELIWESCATAVSAFLSG